MQDMYPLPPSVTFDSVYYISLIEERENIVAICRHNNTKKKGGKCKVKSMKQMIMSLDGIELDTYLREQGFTLNK